MKQRFLLSRHSIISLGILLVLTFIIGNLIYNIQFLDVPSETMPFGPGFGTPSISGTNVDSEGMRWIFIGLFTSIFVVAIGGAILFAIRGEYVISRWEMLGYLLATTILVIVIVGLPDILNFFKQLLGYEGSQTPTNGGDQPGDVSGTGFGYPIGILILVLIAVGIITYYLISRASVTLRTKTKEKAIEKERTELLRYVERAIVDLELGGNPREVILNCYRNLCTYLSEKGLSQKPYYTPREFERIVISRTNIKSKDLKALTTLFEEARYSTHALTDIDRDRAINCLKNFKSEIEILRGDALNV